MRKNRINKVMLGNPLIVGIILLMLHQQCSLIEGLKDEEEQVLPPLETTQEPFLDVSDAKRLLIVQYPSTWGICKETSDGNVERLGLSWRSIETGEIISKASEDYFFDWPAYKLKNISDELLFIDGRFRILYQAGSDTTTNNSGKAIILNKKSGKFYAIDAPGDGTNFIPGIGDHPDIQFKILEENIKLRPDGNKLLIGNALEGIIEIDYSNLSNISSSFIYKSEQFHNYDFYDDILFIQLNEELFEVVGTESQMFNHQWFWKGSDGRMFMTQTPSLEKVFYVFEKSDSGLDTVRYSFDDTFIPSNNFISWAPRSSQSITLVREGYVVFINMFGRAGMQFSEKAGTIEELELPVIGDEGIFAYHKDQFYLGYSGKLFQLDFTDWSLEELFSDRAYEFLSLDTDNGKLYFSGRRQSDDVIVYGIIEDNGTITILNDQLNEKVIQFLELNP